MDLEDFSSPMYNSTRVSKNVISLRKYFNSINLHTMTLKLSQISSYKIPFMLIMIKVVIHYMGLDEKITCLRRLVSNQGTDQPAQMRSLISTFVIHLLESSISRLVTSKI